MSIDQSMRKSSKAGPKFLGTGKAIKLPFVIGTPEYDRHPYAGIVFTGTDFEQTEHF